MLKATDNLNLNGNSRDSKEVDILEIYLEKELTADTESYYDK